MIKKLSSIVPCAVLLSVAPVSVHAQSAADFKWAQRHEKELRKLGFERSRPHREVVRELSPDVVIAAPVLPPPPPLPPAPVVVAVQPVAYNWTGAFVGGYAGASNDGRTSQLQVPTYGALQGNDVGFGQSNLNNSFNVDSQTYNYLAGSNNGNAGLGPVTPGYTTYTATAASTGYNTGAGNTAPTVGVTSVATNNGPVTGFNNSANVTPYNNLAGDRTDSQISSRNNAHRLLGMLGGEVGYRKQFGLFVVGVEADGGFIDGKRNETANSTGQFSNSQGANSTATAAECTSINGNGGCGSSLTNSSNGSVAVNNNGNSSFSQSIQAGPQWLGTARLSAGVAVDRVLLYATGGLAYGQSDLVVSGSYRDTANSVCSGNAASPTGNIGGTSVGYSCNGGVNVGSSYTYSNAAQWNGSQSKFMTGFAVGTGAAFAITDNVTLKLEGIYYNLGSISTTAYGVGSQTLTVNGGNGPAGVAAGTRAASVSPFSVSRTIDGFIAKVGVQIHFDTSLATPIIAAPAPAVIQARY